MTSDLEIACHGSTQIIRLARPAKKNALTTAMYRGLADALEQGDRDDAIRAHVIFGSGREFCAGNDIADFMQAAQSGASLGADILRFITALVVSTKPIIAGVHGRAIGIGTTLLFHCDLVFATPSAQFSTPFIDLGLVPEAGSSLLLPQIAGHHRAFEMLVMGTVFSADRARESGFVNHVVDAEFLEQRALAAAANLAAKPPHALTMSRRLLKGDTKALLARVHEEAELFQDRMTSPEAVAAFTSFLTKRPVEAKSPS